MILIMILLVCGTSVLGEQKIRDLPDIMKNYKKNSDVISIIEIIKPYHPEEYKYTNNVMDKYGIDSENNNLDSQNYGGNNQNYELNNVGYYTNKMIMNPVVRNYRSTDVQKTNKTDTADIFGKFGKCPKGRIRYGFYCYEPKDVPE